MRNLILGIAIGILVASGIPVVSAFNSPCLKGTLAYESFPECADSRIADQIKRNNELLKEQNDLLKQQPSPC